jgi:hypothetical protein
MCALVAHGLLALVALPSYWHRFRGRAWNWPDLLVPVVVPLAFTSILAAQMLDHWGGLSNSTRILGSLGVGACTATVVLALSRLRRLGA